MRNVVSSVRVRAAPNGTPGALLAQPPGTAGAAATPRASCQLGSSRDAPSYLPRYGAAIARDALRWTRLDPLPEWVRGTSSAAAMADSFAQFKEVRAPRRATARARERPCRVGLRWIVVRTQVLAKRNMVLKQAAILEQSAQWLAAEVCACACKHASARARVSACACVSARARVSAREPVRAWHDAMRACMHACMCMRPCVHASMPARARRASCWMPRDSGAHRRSSSCLWSACSWPRRRSSAAT